jgi:hypothetical protein
MAATVTTIIMTFPAEWRFIVFILLDGSLRRRLFACMLRFAFRHSTPSTPEPIRAGAFPADQIVKSITSAGHKRIESRDDSPERNALFEIGIPFQLVRGA